MCYLYLRLVCYIQNGFQFKEVLWSRSILKKNNLFTKKKSKNVHHSSPFFKNVPVKLDRKQPSWHRELIYQEKIYGYIKQMEENLIELS